jgi:hypothetical protein
MHATGEILGPYLRDLLACMLLVGVADWFYTHPHTQAYRVLAISGGVTLLHAVMSTLQEYRSRDTTTALVRRPRIRVPGPQ